MSQSVWVCLFLCAWQGNLPLPGWDSRDALFYPTTPAKVDLLLAATVSVWVKLWLSLPQSQLCHSFPPFADRYSGLCEDRHEEETLYLFNKKILEDIFWNRGFHKFERQETVCVSGQTQLHYRQERLAAELIFNLNNPRTTVLYAKKIGWRWQTTTSHIPFFEEWIRTNGLVVKASSSESGDLGSIPDECWNTLLSLSHFAWHWACLCTDTRTFYIAALSIIFFFLDFVSGYLALTEL